MEKTEAFFISKRLSESKSAEEMAKTLKELGFTSSYLTLQDKKVQLENITDSIEEEERRLRYNPDATQIWGKEGYSLEDLYLVRATDVFNVGNVLTTPKDGQVLSHMDFAFKASEAAKKAVGLPEDYTYEQYKSKEKEIKLFEDKITPYLRQYRSTKHFTVNTLVSDNSGGSWANMPYIFLEPMKPHLDDKSLASIAPHDTFFRGDVKLEKPTLIVQQNNLMQLLNQNNPNITQTLMETEIIVVDDNCKENGSPSAHVAYVLRQMKNAPYYYCHDHGVNISPREGVFKPLYEFAKDEDIPYGSDHHYSDEKKMDELHFTRNIAEDAYRYLAFVRGSEKLNLTEQQKDVIDTALDNFHKTLQEAGERGVPIDFTEDNTPDASYEHLQEQGRNADYNKALDVFNDLYYIVENAFVDSKFYETVDLEVLAEETMKYNEEYKASLEKGSEFGRVESFKPEINSDIVEQ